MRKGEGNSEKTDVGQMEVVQSRANDDSEKQDVDLMEIVQARASGSSALERQDMDLIKDVVNSTNQNRDTNKAAPREMDGMTTIDVGIGDTGKEGKGPPNKQDPRASQKKAGTATTSEKQHRSEQQDPSSSKLDGPPVPGHGPSRHSDAVPQAGSLARQNNVVYSEPGAYAFATAGLAMPPAPRPPETQLERSSNPSGSRRPNDELPSCHLEARPVEDEPVLDLEVEEVDHREIERRQSELKEKRKKELLHYGCLGLILIAALIAITLAVTLGNKKN